jgi:glycogen debranching enzyme
MAAVAPEVLRQALVVLASHQARRTDPEREAEPGKIPHELRWGELAGTGEVPFGAYYGSVDATPLFVVAASEYRLWTDDTELIARLRPALDAAIDWCRAAEERGGGFLTYDARPTHGLKHQGWKDSLDGIPWPDGSPVAGPIALVEAQGYLAAAYAAYAYLVRPENPQLADRLRQRAQAVIRRIDERVSDEDFGYALCLDGQQRPVPTVASNAGHLLWLAPPTMRAPGQSPGRCLAGRCSPAGECGRSVPQWAPTTRSAITRVRSGRTTTRSSWRGCAATGSMAKRRCWARRCSRPSSVFTTNKCRSCSRETRATCA